MVMGFEQQAAPSIIRQHRTMVGSVRARASQRTEKPTINTRRKLGVFSVGSNPKCLSTQHLVRMASDTHGFGIAKQLFSEIGVRNMDQRLYALQS